MSKLKYVKGRSCKYSQVEYQSPIAQKKSLLLFLTFLLRLLFILPLLLPPHEPARKREKRNIDGAPGK